MPQNITSTYDVEQEPAHLSCGSFCNGMDSVIDCFNLDRQFHFRRKTWEIEINAEISTVECCGGISIANFASKDRVLSAGEFVDDKLSRFGHAMQCQLPVNGDWLIALKFDRSAVISRDGEMFSIENFF